MKQSSPENAGHRKKLLVLVIIQVTHIMDFMLLTALAPQLIRIFSIAPNQFALLISAYTISAFVSALLCVVYVNRFDRRNALIFLYSGFLLSILACLIVTDYESLFIARIFSGAFGGVLNAIVYSIVADIFPNEKRGSAIGLLAISFPLSSVAGVPLGLVLANHIGWKASFFLVLALTTAGLLGCIKVIPSLTTHVTDTKKTHPFNQAISILFDANQFKALALASILIFGGFSVGSFIAAYMVSNVGIMEHEIPMLYFFAGLTTMFSSRLIGKLVDRYGKKNMFTWLAIASSVPIIIITNITTATLFSAICCQTLFMVLMSGRFIPAMTIVTSAPYPSHRGTFMSFVTASQQLSLSLASLTSGFIIGTTDNGALTNYSIIGMISVSCLLIAILIARRIKTRG